MANDLTKAPKQIILDMVNAKSGAGFTLATFAWAGLPEVEPSGKNTSLSLVAVAGSGYKNTRIIRYNRMHLGTDIGAAFIASATGRDLVFSIGDATKIADLIPELNARLNIALTGDDFTDGDLPTFTGAVNETHPVQVVVKADSLIYTGSITLTLKADDVDLATAIPDAEMDGLTYAAPPTTP
jgi:hypothetical protein